MRIIAGQWRGRPLAAPAGSATRPTVRPRPRGPVLDARQPPRQLRGPARRRPVRGHRRARPRGAVARRGALHLRRARPGGARRDRAQYRQARRRSAERGPRRSGRARRAAARAAATSSSWTRPTAGPGAGGARPGGARLWLAPGGWISVENGPEPLRLPDGLAIEAERRFGKAHLLLLRQIAGPAPRLKAATWRQTNWPRCSGPPASSTARGAPPEALEAARLALRRRPTTWTRGGSPRGCSAATRRAASPAVARRHRPAHRRSRHRPDDGRPGRLAPAARAGRQRRRPRRRPAALARSLEADPFALALLDQAYVTRLDAERILTGLRRWLLLSGAWPDFPRLVAALAAQAAHNGGAWLFDPDERRAARRRSRHGHRRRLSAPRRPGRRRAPSPTR